MPKKLTYSVLFGYNIAEKEDPDIGWDNVHDGYWTAKGIVDDIHDATLLCDQAKNGSSAQWLKLINDDPDLNFGFRFHLVKTCLTP